jgi:dTDP-4-amino-4,6-dideoxygalactose transaminase
VPGPRLAPTNQAISGTGRRSASGGCTNLRGTQAESAQPKASLLAWSVVAAGLRLPSAWATLAQARLHEEAERETVREETMPVWTEGWPEWPVHDDREIAAATRVLASGNWWRHSYGEGVALTEDAAQGPRSEVAIFQQAFAQVHGCRFGTATVNGTVSMEIALRALGVRPGDEVLVPAYTFIATAAAPLMINAVPVFVDIEPDTYNLDPTRLEEAITARTRAILPVHFGGQPADMQAINALAAKHGLVVLEDAAHAHGAQYDGRSCGALADAASFSFQASKPMTAGEGGVITTNRPEVAELCESLIWAGRREGMPWYRHFLLAGNARMTELQGALLSVQLSRLAAQVQTRLANARMLDALLAGIEGVTPCAVRPTTTVHSYHIYLLRYTPGAFGGLSKADFVTALQAEGIAPAAAGYERPLYQNPMFLEGDFWGDGCPVRCPRRETSIDYASFAARCPVAERACDSEAVWLTMPALMGTARHLQAIADAIIQIQRRARRGGA